MKTKQLLLVSALFLSFGANAQIKKGSTLLGGQIGFTSQKQNSGDLKQSNFYLSPEFGKAINDNLVIGGRISLGFNSETNLNDEYKYSSFGPAFFVRKYGTLGKGFYIFGDASAGLSLQNGKNTSNNMERKVTGIGAAINLYPGAAYTLTDKFMLEISLPNLLNVQYQSLKRHAYPNNPESKTSSFGATASLSGIGSLNIGFRFLLNKAATANK